MRKIAVFIAAVVATTAAAPASAQLVANGSFESFSGGTVQASVPDRFKNTGSGSLVVPNWDFDSSPSADIYRDFGHPNATSSSYRASDGSFFAGGTHEGVSTTIAVAPDTSYMLSFDMAPGSLYNPTSGTWLNAPIPAAGSRLRGWDVSVTGAVVAAVSERYPINLSDFDINQVPNPVSWTTRLLSFTSNSVGGNVTIAFDGYSIYDGIHGGGYVFLDNVSVEVGPPFGSCSVSDLDGDGFPNPIDSCPTIPNPTEQGLGPGVRGAACSSLSIDLDADGIADGEDNCPLVENLLQEDSFQVPNEYVAMGDACCLRTALAGGLYCVEGYSTGVPFAWVVDDALPAGPDASDAQNLNVTTLVDFDSPAAIASKFSASIDAESGVSSSSSANCFSVSPGNDLYVGAATILPICLIGGPPGCSFNPTITLIATPLPALGGPPMAWLVLVLLVSGLGARYGNQLRHSSPQPGPRTG